MYYKTLLLSSLVAVVIVVPNRYYIIIVVRKHPIHSTQFAIKVEMDSYTAYYFQVGYVLNRYLLCLNSEGMALLLFTVSI